MKKQVIRLFVGALLALSCSACGAETADGGQAEANATVTTQDETGKGQHIHSYAETVTAEATCEEDGLKTYTCECGDSYTEAIVATGHNFATYSYNEDATYTTDGTETANCECGETDTRTVDGTKLEYTYTDLDDTMYVTEAVTARDLPSEEGNELGSLEIEAEVHITGQCNETSWYRIELDGAVAYVSGDYLVSEMPVWNEETVEENTPATSTSTLESCPYELLTLYDDGGKEITYYYIYNGTYDYVEPMNEATDILFERGYTKTYTDENGSVWTTACVAWDYVEHEYAEGTVIQCNVFYGEFLNSITGLPQFHGEGTMVATRY